MLILSYSYAEILEIGGAEQQPTHAAYLLNKSIRMRMEYYACWGGVGKSKRKQN